MAKHMTWLYTDELLCNGIGWVSHVSLHWNLTFVVWFSQSSFIGILQNQTKQKNTHPKSQHSASDELTCTLSLWSNIVLRQSNFCIEKLIYKLPSSIQQSPESWCQNISNDSSTSFKHHELFQSIQKANNHSSFQEKKPNHWYN